MPVEAKTRSVLEKEMMLPGTGVEEKMLFLESEWEKMLVETGVEEKLLFLEPEAERMLPGKVGERKMPRLGRMVHEM